MPEIATGYIDKNIKYCPYCGAELEETSSEEESVCEKCGKSFIVLEGE